MTCSPIGFEPRKGTLSARRDIYPDRMFIRVYDSADRNETESVAIPLHQRILLFPAKNIFHADTEDARDSEGGFERR